MACSTLRTLKCPELPAGKPAWRKVLKALTVSDVGPDQR